MNAAKHDTAGTAGTAGTAETAGTPSIASPGVVLPTISALEATTHTIAQVQAPCGAIPWETSGDSAGKVDAWDHTECAMALVVTGRDAEAEAAYAWLAQTQRADGTWPIEWRLHGGEPVVVDAGADANQCAYLAVGVLHHWSIRQDLPFVQCLWPTIDSALDAVVALQLPTGGIAWGRGSGGTFDEALLSSSSSIAHALRCGLGLAAVLGKQRPAWRRALDRLAAALRRHCAWEAQQAGRFTASTDGDAPTVLFADRRRFSMDWYYPVLGGALSGLEALERIDAGWESFVVPGLGIRCIEGNPWVTGAETCELALALQSCGRRSEAALLISDMQHLRDEDGAYHTGLVYTDGQRWPIERSSWTGAAVVLAVDALTGLTPGGEVFRLGTESDF